MNFPKTLIIGLGGLGSDIVTDVYSRFNNHALHEDDKRKVRFLALDTDSNEIYERRKIMSPDDVIQTSSTTNVVAGRFIDDIKDYSDIENWFPVEVKELRLMTINDGAGQIRAISRLAFSHAIYSGRLNRLKQVLDELLNVNVGEGNNIEVHIVTSLAGGTGAGSFLQTAYLVREYLLRGGIANPKVLGYFVLGDVFLHDPGINLSDPNKTTSILANTYASIKELNGIYTIPEGKEIPFEYGSFGSNFKITQESSVPFTQCFLYGFENNDGNNIRTVSNYKKQVEDFLYLNAFSPTGPRTRSEMINSIFERIQSGADSRYASTGISKIVYPIDNLLEYFSNRRLKDNLKGTWLKIDRDFDELHKEYVLDTNKGIIKTEPKLSEFFIRNVELLAQNGTGVEQAVFKNIWTSAKVMGGEKGDEFIGYKSDYLLDEIVAYLEDLRDRDADINALSQVSLSESFLDNDTDKSNDIAQIKEIEDQLGALKSETFSFIEDSKRMALEEIFTKDISSQGYFNEEVKHRINTYVLQKGKTMHPLAQRYFYYQLLEKLEDTYEVLVENNANALTRISNYDAVYDIKDDKGGEDAIIETAVEAYNVFHEKNSKILSKLSSLIGGANDLKEFKKVFNAKSKKQGRLLKDYALSKLQEFVFEGLVFQTKKMIENLETLFKTIPDVITGLENKYNALTAVTNYDNSSIIYVLSGKKHREHIYNETVAARDSIFFPEDMSRSIYEEVYHRTYQQINNPVYYSNDNTDKRIKSIFEEMVVDKQIENFKEMFKDDFAGYNIIQAMQKQAELDKAPDKLDFMKVFFREAETKATPYGAKYESTATKINAWALHPECIEYQYLNPQDADYLFNNAGEAQNNASRVISDYFNRTEIIREDSVMVLKVPDNYPKFGPVNPDLKYSISHEGIYYQYYKKRMKEIQENPDLPLPHLDKRWTSPIMFPDLGISGDVYKNKIFRAYFWGLAKGYILPFNNHGTMVWGYNGLNNRGVVFFKDKNRRPLKIKINNLLTEGLWNNEGVVNEVIMITDRAIEEAKNIWKTIRMEGKSIKTLDLIKSFTRYKFRDFEGFEKQNLLSIFNGYLTENDTEAISFIIDEIINTLIKITENTGEDTKRILMDIFEKMTREMRNDTPVTKSYVKQAIKQRMDNLFN